MKRLHEQEKKQFKKLFKQERIADFENRLIVLEAFLQTEKHVTVAELIALLKDSGHQLESGFVKDTLKLMCRFGFALQSRFDNGDLRYEHRHLGQHHDHMVCAKCRKIIEFHDDRLESRLSASGRASVAVGRWTIFADFLLGFVVNELELTEVPPELAGPNNEIRYFVPGTSRRVFAAIELGGRFRLRF